MDSRSIYLDGEYLKKNPTYHVEDSPWKAQQVLRMLDKHALQPASICEIGCGAGEILRQLQLQLPSATRFHGYEISPQAYELCRERENDRLAFYCEDLLARETETYDLLLCMDVFEHVDDYLGFLRKLRDKARQTVFHIPLDMSAQAVMRGMPLVRARTAVGHIHYFMKETALLTLQEAGFTVVDHFYTASSLVRNRGLRAKLTNLPRRVLPLFGQDWAVRVLGGYSLLVLTR